jgi:hypothetical protein
MTVLEFRRQSAHAYSSGFIGSLEALQAAADSGLRSFAKLRCYMAPKCPSSRA